MTPKEVAENLRKDNTLAGALSIAEGLVKKMKLVSLGDLPDLGQIANDSHVSESLRKSLIQRERRKPQEVSYEQRFWENVAGILRRQQKA